MANGFNPIFLRLKIKDKGLTESEFAERFGISKTSMSKKLNRKTKWTVDELLRATEILGINDPGEIALLLFRH